MARRWLPLWIASSIATLVFATPMGGRATEPVTASLSWVRLPGSESCIPTQTLARAVEARLHKRVFVSPSVAELAIEGRIEPLDGGGWKATVHATEADGTDLGVRILETADEDCRAIDDNLSLVVALTIDPEAVEKWAEPPSPPPPAPPPSSPPPKVVVKRERVLVPVVSGPPPAKEPVTGAVRVAATLSRGILPGTAWGLLAAGRLDLPAFWPIELTGYGWTEREAAVAGGGASFSMLSVALTVCPSIELAPTLRGTACSGISAGALRARGFGFDQVDEGTKPVVGVVASLRVGWTFYGPLFATLGGGVQAGVVRARFVVNEPDGSTRDVYQMPAVGGMGELGLGIEFLP